MSEIRKNDDHLNVVINLNNKEERKISDDKYASKQVQFAVYGLIAIFSTGMVALFFKVVEYYFSKK